MRGNMSFVRTREELANETHVCGGPYVRTGWRTTSERQYRHNTDQGEAVAGSGKLRWRADINPSHEANSMGVVFRRVSFFASPGSGIFGLFHVCLRKTSARGHGTEVTVCSKLYVMVRVYFEVEMMVLDTSEATPDSHTFLYFEVFVIPTAVPTGGPPASTHQHEPRLRGSEGLHAVSVRALLP